MAQNKMKTFSLEGGEDFVTPDLVIKDGMARFAENFEQDYNTGYTKMAGFRNYLGSAALPGEGPILGLFMFDRTLRMYRKKVGLNEIDLFQLFKAVWNTDGTEQTPGSWLAGTVVLDYLGAPTTLTYSDRAILQTVQHNFKAVGSTTTSSLDEPYIDSDYNFGKIYGADGVNPAFEFNGFNLQQIKSTYTPDIPRHIEANGNRLALGFRAGEIAMSVLGDPTDFSAVSGAGSIGVTDSLTGMSASPDGSMYIFTKNKSYIFYGMSGPLANAELKKYSKDVGCLPYTNQTLGDKSLMWDKYGLTTIDAVERFGDIASNSISNKVQYRFDTMYPRCSTVIGSKAQYRVYLVPNVNDHDPIAPTQALLATMIRGGSLGITHATFPFTVGVCSYGTVFWDGTETADVHVVGTTAGDVYEMDAGTSYDGVAYTSTLVLPFTHAGSPGYAKKFRKIDINVDAAEETTIQFAAEFSFGRTGDSREVVLAPSGALWGTKSWGDFVWGGGTVGHLESYINGHGENMSLTITSTGDDVPQYTLKDISITYQMQRINR